ncbi:glycosyltransferase [Halanaerobium sp. MA284_MarDTE_T2]|uniref:glycosyltransferase n=1 Tax=Halanaerobium sp. MA284_MarDTE_T2 TaxID=2183913 RepID=UPI000E15AEB2|nr:glycosyltransferase [Halanaerobium sp. MA284_MarDTE_T2]RCW45011.1 glycosyltransferase involved in cell wall biosynthesis [Halanaerobium sp. MA284_MarDTE_T2]
MNIVYVFFGDWPCQEAGINFSTLTSYGLAESNKNNINLIVSKNNDKNYNYILKNYFNLNPLDNFKVGLIDNNFSISKSTSFYIKALKKIKNIHKNRKVDAVITRTVGFLPYLLLLKKFLNIKVFYEAHDFYLDLSLERVKRKKKKFIFQKWFLPKLDGIICHQNILKELYKKYIPNQNYCVARTGIRKITYSDDLWNNKYIGYIGSLQKRKKIEDLFYAIKKIKNKEIKLMIIGGRDKETINYYLDLIRELGLEDKVKITGWVDKIEVEKNLKKLKIGIVPLADTFFNRYLTSPMKIFDYFSHGIPVIATDLPPNREIITEKCGLFYKPGDIDSLVNAINELNSSKEIYDYYSNNIIEKSKELLWKKRGEIITNFIKSV